MKSTKAVYDDEKEDHHRNKTNCAVGFLFENASQKKKTFRLLLIRSGFKINLSGEENKKYKTKCVTGNVEHSLQRDEPMIQTECFC